MNKKLIYTLLFPALLSTSCADNNEWMHSIESNKFQISVITNSQGKGRAVIDGGYLLSGSTIGVTIMDQVSLAEYEGIEYKNVKYTASGSGEKQTWTGAKDLELVEYDAMAIAYYPYSSSKNDYTALSVSAGTTDYMYSGWVYDLNINNYTAAFNMKHAMTALRIIIKKENYDGEGKLTNIKFKSPGLGSSAKLNAETGVLSSISGLNTLSSYSLTKTITESGTTIDWMMVPDGKGKELDIRCTIDGVEYTKIISLNQVMEQGDMVKANFVLTRNDMQIQKVEVTPWTIYEQEETNLDTYNDYLTLTYNVTSTTNNTILINYNYLSHVSSMYIDGVSKTPVSGFKFSSTGLHEVKFKFKDETKIGGGTSSDYMFEECPIRNILTFPSQLEEIRNYTFYQRSIKSLPKFPEKLKVIGAQAFAGCTGLTAKLVFPQSLSSIGNGAFQNCKGIREELFIPKSVISIGTNPFSGCTGLISIIVEDGNNVYDSRDNCNAIIETGTNTLILGCKNTIIPESVTKIGQSAFYQCSGITEITIPESVTTIGYYAFQGCTLEKIDLPDTIEEIGYQAFYSCTKLSGTLVLPQSLQKIGDYAFAGGNGLSEIVINNSLSSIGKNAFSGCSNLKKIVSYAVNAPVIGADLFSNIGQNGTIIVPKGCIEAYSTWMTVLNTLGWTIQEMDE